MKTALHQHRIHVMLAMLAVCLLTVSLVSASALAITAAVAAVNDTQDVITMRDGRVLEGKIVEETGDHIVFLYIDPNIRIQSRLTLNKQDIAKIDRDVVVDRSAPATPAPSQPEPMFEPEDVNEPAEQRVRGLAEGAADDESLPAFYVIPMKGQMGTDIRLDVYARIIDDIRRLNPDVVVWQLESRDQEDEILAPLMADREERGLSEIDEYRVLVQRLHDELSGSRQVMWVHDAYGVSSVMALAWPEMYMAPNARLVGMGMFFTERGGDEDIKAKMREAMMGAGNAFLQRGGHPVELGYGLMNPSAVLSASWHGRQVRWHNHLNGEYVVNSSNRHTATFTAKTAEDFGISRGTAETLDDLALLLGYREYRVIEGEALRYIRNYMVGWRRELDRVWEKFGDYQQHLAWAQGEDQAMYLGRALSDLQDIVRAMRRYPAIETRVMMRGEPDRVALELEIERLRHQIADMRRRPARRR